MQIHGRHFVQTGKAAGLPMSRIKPAIEKMADMATETIERIESEMPKTFPGAIPAAVGEVLKRRLTSLKFGSDNVACPTHSTSLNRSGRIGRRF